MVGMKGKLYGVGIGPGDPKLLTLRAVEVLRAADVVALPDTGGERTALAIAGEYIEGKEILACPSPMTRNEETLRQARQESADRISKQLDQGLTVAFITLGDPTVYSTYLYLHRELLSRGYEAEIIPGVPSFCAAAAALNTSLCDGGQALHIIPASYPDVEKLLRLDGNKVLMKSGKSLQEVREQLKQLGLADQTSMVECCSMENQRIYRSLSEVPEEASYFSILLVKEEQP